MPQASRLFSATSWVVRVATLLSLGLDALLTLVVFVLAAAALHLFTLPIPPSVTGGLPVAVVLLAAAMVVVACIIVVAIVAIVLMLVGRIVESARSGDPFVVRNATRLNTIGGLLLAIQAVGFVTGMIVSAFPKPISHNLNFGFDVSATGLFTALLVFVLAQIFRYGSEMRAELDGTI